MEINQKQQHYQLDSRQSGAIELPASNETDESQEKKEVVPGVPVIRSNTPRPLSFEAMLSTDEHSQREQQGEALIWPTFPEKAPSAPPLPEELGGREEENRVVSFSSEAESSAEEPQEFIWLFEYGLEMDSTLLNSSERLEGLALCYGPAVLRGYSLMFMSVETNNGERRTITTIVPGSESDAEVWGVLYRIPRRLTEHMSDEPSVLDIAHAVEISQNIFSPVRTIVREIYRNRDITCITYIMADSARQKFHPLSLEQGGEAMFFLQHLAAIARKQKLPDRYLSRYMIHTAVGDSEQTLPAEQNTDPLTLLKEKSPVSSEIGAMPKSLANPHTSRWLSAFAIYLFCVLLLLLTFAVLQGLGFGNMMLTDNFMPLGVPWQELVYGLLGGCASSIITLGRSRSINPPVFVIITWFTRPYIGVVLAILVYLFLNSGFFVFSSSVGVHSRVFLLAGVLAGLCESWFFVRRR